MRALLERDHLGRVKGQEQGKPCTPGHTAARDECIPAERDSTGRVVESGQPVAPVAPDASPPTEQSSHNLPDTLDLSTKPPTQALVDTLSAALDYWSATEDSDNDELEALGESWTEQAVEGIEGRTDAAYEQAVKTVKEDYPSVADDVLDDARSDLRSNLDSARDDLLEAVEALKQAYVDVVSGEEESEVFDDAKEEFGEAREAFSKAALAAVLAYRESAGEAMNEVAEAQNTEWETEASDHADTLNEMLANEDEDGATEDVAIYNRELEEAGNPFRVQLGEDGEYEAYLPDDEEEEEEQKAKRALVVFRKMFDWVTKGRGGPCEVGQNPKRDGCVAHRDDTGKVKPAGKPTKPPRDDTGRVTPVSDTPGNPGEVAPSPSEASQGVQDEQGHEIVAGEKPTPAEADGTADVAADVAAEATEAATWDAADVERDRLGDEHLADWNFYDDNGELYEQSVYLEHGTVEDSAGDEVDVWRWASAQGNDVVDRGDWVDDESEAREEGENYAESNNMEPPEVEEEPYETSSDADDLISSMLDGDLDKAKPIIGAPDDAELEAEEDGGKLKITVTHPHIEICERTLGVDRHDKKYIHNDILRVNEESAPPGFGAGFFTREVEGAAAEGYEYLETHAAGSWSRHKSWNGYYTWPMFGYDEPLRSVGGEAYRKAAEVFPDAENVSDIFDVDVVELPEEDAAEIRGKLEELNRELVEKGKRPRKLGATISGADWWMVHGSDMHDAKFDLREGSKSRKRLAAYLKKKKGA
jgi:hypothetical protein